MKHYGTASRFLEAKRSGFIFDQYVPSIFGNFCSRIQEHLSKVENQNLDEVPTKSRGSPLQCPRTILAFVDIGWLIVGISSLIEKIARLISSVFQ